MKKYSGGRQKTLKSMKVDRSLTICYELVEPADETTISEPIRLLSKVRPFKMFLQNSFAHCSESISRETCVQMEMRTGLNC